MEKIEKKEFNKIIEESINVKPCYFVCVSGDVVFESESLAECKRQLKIILKNHYEGITSGVLNEYDYFVGMYNISL